MAIRLSEIRTVPVFCLALLLRLALMVYAEWQDARPMGVKYTDVDYWVFTEAAQAVAAGASPFSRATYRYTPLLAWMMLPACWAPLRWWGKMLFSLCDLIVGYFLLSGLRRHYGLPIQRSLKIVSLAWLFNPMIFTISTRGNAESLLCVLVLGTLHYLLQGRLHKAGLAFGLAVHFKLFPAIYSFAFLPFIWNEAWLAAPELKASISQESIPPAAFDSDSSSASSKTRSRTSSKRHIYTSTGSLRLRNFGKAFRRLGHLVRFALASLLSFTLTTGAMLKIYGRPYLQEGFLHHLVRKDHRHNFSPYFLPFYLESIKALPEGINLAAFIPQVLLLMVIGLKYGRKRLPFACFLQTFAFVTFNKVCTSQVQLVVRLP